MNNVSSNDITMNLKMWRYCRNPSRLQVKGSYRKATNINNIAMSPPTTFERFSDLPTELRLNIWRYSLPRRIVQLSRKRFQDRLSHWERQLQAGLPLMHLGPRLHKLPPQLRVNRESRSELNLLYQPFLCKWLNTLPFSPVAIERILCNPDHDILFLDDAPLPPATCHFLTPVALMKVKYLALQDLHARPNGVHRHRFASMIRSVMKLISCAKMLEAVYILHGPDFDEELDGSALYEFMDPRIDKMGPGIKDPTDQERFKRFVRSVYYTNFRAITGAED